ncbi:nuclear speckle splicing regulatory protein 1-like [Strongylocentrotus purpuratus]|uniref:SET domain-containing protein n=1 Tax=Strongylocentrotus purpuratus TaxID=7668 RepID=A0A7M7T1H6_STRPU|nr:nuclear speckle splicing regulatory protein 1-like [Strongylocentrotus purpuratus]
MLTRRRHCGVGKPNPLEVAAQYTEKEKDPPHFIVKLFENKGRGIVAQRDISKGEFLLEYPGQLISAQEGNQREEEESSGFRFFFKHQGQSYCLDATDECAFGDRLGRLVNHGQGREENARMKILDMKSHPHMWIIATKNISKGTEVLYNYGVRELPWKKKHFRGQVQREEEEGETQVHQQERGTLGQQQEGEMQVHQQEGQTQGHEQERGTLGHQQGEDIHVHQQGETQVHQQGETEDHQQERGTQIHQQGGDTHVHQQEGETEGHLHERETLGHQQGETQERQRATSKKDRHKDMNKKEGL